jgi:hypothetical protein
MSDDHEPFEAPEPDVDDRDGFDDGAVLEHPGWDGDEADRIDGAVDPSMLNDGTGDDGGVVDDTELVPVTVDAAGVINAGADDDDTVEPAVAVESGAVDAAIVYRTDVRMSVKASVAWVVPADRGPRILYPAAIIATSVVPGESKRFIDYLRSDPAARLFERFGFVVAR